MDRRRSFRPLPVVFLALLALAAALPATAEIQGVTIEVHPAAPTWKEDVTIIVRG